MLIAQRTRELGLLRALGADRRQVRRSVLTEALLLGFVGSTLGLAAGIGLAAGLIELMGLLGMNLSAAEMVVDGGDAGVRVFGRARCHLRGRVSAGPARGRVSPWPRSRTRKSRAWDGR